MIGGHQFSTAKIEPLSAEMRNAAVCFENGLCGGASETDDYLWSDRVNLAEQKRGARSDFIFFGRTIFWWTAFDDIADVDVFSLQAHRFDHLRKKLSGTSDEGKALHVFIVSGTFADENEFSFGIAVAKNDRVARFVKLAARAFAQVGSNLRERVPGNPVERLEE